MHRRGAWFIGLSQHMSHIKESTESLEHAIAEHSYQRSYFPLEKKNNNLRPLARRDIYNIYLYL